MVLRPVGTETSFDAFRGTQSVCNQSDGSRLIASESEYMVTPRQTEIAQRRQTGHTNSALSLTLTYSSSLESSVIGGYVMFPYVIMISRYDRMACFSYTIYSLRGCSAGLDPLQYLAMQPWKTLATRALANRIVPYLSSTGVHKMIL